MDNQQSDVLTPEEQLRLLGDKLISSMIQKSDVCQRNKTYIFSIFNEDMFRNENYLIYHMLYRQRELNIFLDSEFLEIFYMNNTKVLKDADSKIDLVSFQEEGVDEYVSYIAATIKHFNRLLGMRPMEEDDFKLTCEKYRIIFQSIEASKIFGVADRILVSGYKDGRKEFVGYEDSKAYINKEFARIDSISTREAGEGFVLMRGFEEKNDRKKRIKIADWGIRELDSHFRGIYTSTFISILAPPKNGKTKFCANIAHKVSVENGYGVAIWAIEGGRIAFDAQLRAKHFNYIYNKDITDIRQKKIGVDASVIKDNHFENEQIRQLEEASRIDLYNNPNYGEIGYITTPCNVEDFTQQIDTMVQLIDAKIVVIDYLQLIGSLKGGKKNEVIGEAYKKLLVYCNDKNITVMSPAQYTQEFIKDMSKNGESGAADARTSGGESAEIIRTPDVNIGLWASEEDLIRGQMSLLSIPSRDAKPFRKIDILCELGCCDFYSMPEYMKREED